MKETKLQQTIGVIKNLFRTIKQRLLFLLAGSLGRRRGLQDGKLLYDCNEEKYGYSFYNFTETDFKHIEKFEKEYPLANYAMVDSDYNLIQLFQDYKEVFIYRKIFDCTEVKLLSLFHNYFTTSYYEWEEENWKSSDYIKRFREEYTKTYIVRYRDFTTKS